MILQFVCCVLVADGISECVRVCVRLCVSVVPSVNLPGITVCIAKVVVTSLK